MKFEKWSPGYWFLKQYVIFADWIIHERVIVTGKENIPKNKPIIFAPNHQNALSDPMAVLLHSPFQPVWLARADIFKQKFVGLILRFLKIIPVYRIRDGKENLNRNDETFAVSVKVLENNKALALFPEAAHSGKRQMLPHKKAVPRIAFMAAEKTNFELDIHVIPTGIYYSHYWKFNRTVIVKFGKPVRVNNYIDQYRLNPGVAVNKLKDELQEAMLPLVINIKSKLFYNGFEAIRRIYGERFLKKQGKSKGALNRFYSDQLLVNQLDQIEKHDPDNAEKLAIGAESYKQELKKLGLKNRILDEENRLMKLLSGLLLLIAGLPLFVYGFILNAIPFFMIDRTIRSKVKDTTFWSTFFLLSGIILFPLYYLILLAFFSPLLPGLWIKLLFLASLPLTGKIAFNWYLLMRKTIKRLRLISLKQNSPSKYRQIIEQQNRLYEMLDTMLKVHPA